MAPSYIVITPVRNESQFLPLTIACMKKQTLKPRRWVIVDDGSEDDTGAIAEAAAASEPWIEVIRRGNRGFRLSGKGVVDAFNDGYQKVANQDWDFISKFDGDLSFDPDYFERCLAEFQNDSKLGMGGGLCCVQRGEERVAEFPSDPPFHVRGPTKIYRRACWEAIGGLRNVPGWDGIDELKANMLGWQTRTFQPIRLIHHRPTGNADGVWKNQNKFGRA
ncbi:MAG: glycosyltransferase family 2 protein, partial [Akkermansiaceae bacterium]|nr:glycosyltransferase family 2 protein [Verrucomicrobiales bacterium]